MSDRAMPDLNVTARLTPRARFKRRRIAADRARVPATAANDLATLVRSSSGVVAWVPTSDELIAWVKSRSHALSLSQCAVGDHLGLPKSRMSEVMHGRRRLTVCELHKLAELFGPLPDCVTLPPVTPES